jgi:hypothetical protein
MGYEHTDSEEEADVLGNISCSVRQKPIDKVYSRIHEWNQWKQHKSLIGQFVDLRITSSTDFSRIDPIQTEGAL